MWPFRLTAACLLFCIAVAVGTVNVAFWIIGKLGNLELGGEIDGDNKSSLFSAQGLFHLILRILGIK